MIFEFKPKWKEELVCICGKHEFTVELRMGKMHIYFPTEPKWESMAPSWAKGMWESARDQTKTWAVSQNIPFDVDLQAWIAFNEIG